jgi:putative hemolysin
MELPIPTLPVASFEVAPLRRAEPALDVVWARHLDEVRAAQRLRYQVFVEEMGARPDPPAGTPAEHDADLFDRYCEHLIVRTRETSRTPARVIGTYRVLTPWAAVRAGGLYSDTEFDLAPLRKLRPRMIELGRSCVHVDWRHGSVIMLLWAAVADLMRRNDLDTLIGCASIGMRDGGHVAASLWNSLKQTNLAHVERQVSPRLALPVEQLDSHLQVDPPPLVKGYLRCGSKVLGPPAWDPAFNTADLPLMMQLADLPSRYRRHFLGS